MLRRYGLLCLFCILLLVSTVNAAVRWSPDLRALVRVLLRLSLDILLHLSAGSRVYVRWQISKAVGLLTRFSSVSYGGRSWPHQITGRFAFPGNGF